MAESQHKQPTSSPSDIVTMRSEKKKTLKEKKQEKKKEKEKGQSFQLGIS